MIYLEINKEFELLDSKDIWDELESLGFSVSYELTNSGKCKFYLKPRDMIHHIVEYGDETDLLFNRIPDKKEDPMKFYTYNLVLKTQDKVIPLKTQSFTISRFIRKMGNRFYVFPYILPEGYQGPLDRITCIVWIDIFGDSTNLNLSPFHTESETKERLRQMGLIKKEED